MGTSVASTPYFAPFLIKLVLSLQSYETLKRNPPHSGRTHTAKTVMGQWRERSANKDTNLRLAVGQHRTADRCPLNDVTYVRLSYAFLLIIS